MLTEAKNQLKISLLSVKYALMREMLNKVTFITNILFMILNNVSFIIEWIILYSVKDNIGGYTLDKVELLWGLAAGTYGVSRFFFKKSFELSDIINKGMLDNYLVQPKNVLISAITSDITVSAIGDLIYSYIMLFVSGVTFTKFVLFTILIISGGLIVTGISIILASLSFWFGKMDTICDIGDNLMINFATYPEGIFKGIAKVILFTIVPVGISNYIPVRIITKFNLKFLLINLIFTLFIITSAFYIFYKGLKKYSSGNLMIGRI